MQLGSHCLFARLISIAMPGGLAAGTLHCKFSEREKSDVMFSACIPSLMPAYSVYLHTDRLTHILVPICQPGSVMLHFTCRPHAAQ